MFATPVREPLLYADRLPSYVPGTVTLKNKTRTFENITTAINTGKHESKSNTNMDCRTKQPCNNEN